MTEEQMDQLTDDLINNRTELYFFVSAALAKYNYTDEHINGIVNDLANNRLEIFNFIQETLDED